MSEQTIQGAGVLIHPNFKSSQMSSPNTRSTSSDRRLKKGCLYSVQKTGGDPKASITLPLLGSTMEVRLPTGRPEIITTLKKNFQYNPPDLNMSIGMSPIDPAESTSPGGALASESQIGTATTGVDLLFDRTQETYKAQRNVTNMSQYRRLGVAKDILDVYAVIKGDEEMLKANSEVSLSQLTNEMTDLVSRGSQILMGYRVALQYSEDFIIYGLVVGMQFRFVKFNHQLVPVMGHVKLDIDIHNAGNSALVRNEMIGGADSPKGTTGVVIPAPTNSGWGGPDMSRVR